MIKYKIKQQIITTPEIELPEGSQVVSVKHHDAYYIAPPYPEGGDVVDMPESWQVVWLEPK